MLKNIFKHIEVIMKHKWYVFKLCCKKVKNGQKVTN